MKKLNFINSLHKKTKRNYLERVNNKSMPKYLAAIKAKKWAYDYWDGSRDVCYGGYNYIKGRNDKLVKKIINYYKLNNKSKILDVGCGKGFLLYDFTKFLPGIEVVGIDISKYAIKNSKKEIKNYLHHCNAIKLPFKKKYFDLALSMNTFHNLYNYELEKALIEFSRVAKKNYLCVESYRNELEKQNLLYWQVTCESFCTESEWRWWFKKTNYKGDYSLIYFE